MSAGQRGKWAEGEVRKAFKLRAERFAGFDYYRFPDARAGSFSTVPADFETVQGGHNYLIEVKEVKITTLKSRRLPYNNFSIDKVARMVRRQLAGATCWVVVCFLPAKEWRLVPLSFFTVRAGGASASWDLSGWPVTTLPAAITEMFGSVAALPKQNLA